jgi:hypothetical protein
VLLGNVGGGKISAPPVSAENSEGAGLYFWMFVLFFGCLFYFFVKEHNILYNISTE